MRSGLLAVLLVVAAIGQSTQEELGLATDLATWWEKVVPSSPGKELLKECEQGCTEKGNCNVEEGRCECQWGFTGPTCKQAQLGACRTAENDLPFVGTFIPKSCECYKQAMDFFSCRAPDYHSTCEHSLYQFRIHEMRCFEIEGRKPEEQFSAIPAEGAAGVKWKRFNPGAAKFDDIPPEEGRKAINIWGHPCRAMPLDACPNSCSRQGFCIKDCFKDNKPAWCECHKGYRGADCSEVKDECFNNCNGRGKCIRGFCHCEAGYFGLDCSRSKAYEPQPDRHPDWKRPRIYVYELPASISAPLELDDNIPDTVPIYSAFDRFTATVLRDPAIRTENPWEANLFLIPDHMYSYSSNVHATAPHLRRLIRYLNETYPFYARNDGRDHFIFVPGDRGACYAPPESLNLIKLVHFGYHLDQTRLKSLLMPQPPDFVDSCLSPVRDIVAPPYNDLGIDGARKIFEDFVKNKGEAPDRKNLFFFAGGVRAHDTSYSGGVRQAIQVLLKGLKSGVKSEADDPNKDVVFIEGSTPDYAKLYLNTNFCLAPHGSGFGIRLSIAVVHGCIPVVIQDHVFQPLETELPYELFSVRIAKKDIPSLIPILRSITQEEQRRMRMQLAKYYTAFIWEPELGGLAYNWTVQALFSRVQAYRGEIYHHRSRRLLGAAGALASL